MKIALRLFDFHRTMQWLEARGGATGIDATQPTMGTLVLALARARRYAPYRGNCLSQSLALWWALRRRGIATDLVLGAKIDDGQFAAHAWIEARGVVLNDRADVRERFAALTRPATSRETAAIFE